MSHVSRDGIDIAPLAAHVAHILRRGAEPDVDEQGGRCENGRVDLCYALRELVALFGREIDCMGDEVQWHCCGSRWD